MSKGDWHNRIEDIIESIENVQSFVKDMSWEEFAGDLKTIRAAACEIMIIGEAAANIPDEVRALYPNVPWDEMRGIRNVVVHEYFRLDISILWQTVKEDLPKLVEELRSIQQDPNSDKSK